jgi:hypothetical protein
MVSGPLFVPQRVNPQTAPLQCVPADDNDGLYEAGEAIYIMHERTTLSGADLNFLTGIFAGFEKENFLPLFDVAGRGHDVTRRGKSPHSDAMYHTCCGMASYKKKLETEMASCF